MQQVFIDTNIIIDYIKNEDYVLKDLLIAQHLSKIKIYISPVVVAEYFVDKNLLDKKQLAAMVRFFSYFSVKTITPKIGYLAGELMRKKYVLFIGDALHAATCLLYNLELVTRNTKHFKAVPYLKIYPLAKNIS